MALRWLVGAAVLGMLIAPAHAYAAAGQARWVTRCTVGPHTFRLVFDSPSGDVAEDDMRVTVEGNGERRVAPFPPRWYFPTAIASGANSICDATAALAIDQDHAMVFVSVNDRPDYSLLVAVAIDATDNRANAPVIVARSDEPVDLYKDFARAHAVQGANPKVRNSDGPDAYFFAWRRLAVKGMSLVGSWETPPPKGCKAMPAPRLALP